jgi:hypothetical protein
LFQPQNVGIGIAWSIVAQFQLQHTFDQWFHNLFADLEGFITTRTAQKNNRSKGYRMSVVRPA